ncbi:hypothetical protein BZG19_04390 [Salinivibrio kushneri]|nr:hypothetical protein BZG19_04390 [Salinivibrio kushneri]
MRAVLFLRNNDGSNVAPECRGASYLIPVHDGDEEMRLIDLVIRLIFYVKRPLGMRCAGIRTVTKITKIHIRGKNYPF